MGLMHETRTTKSVIAGVNNFNLDHENAPYTRRRPAREDELHRVPKMVLEDVTRDDGQHGHVQDELHRVHLSKMVQATLEDDEITVRMSFDGTASKMETLDPRQTPMTWHEQTLDPGQEQAIAKYLLTLHHSG